MIRLLVAGFLIAHGLLHPAIYAIPAKSDAKAPFDPAHSWVLAGMHVAARPARVTAVALSAVTAVLYAVTALALLAGASPWTVTAVAAVATALLLKIAYFHPWLTLGVALDLAVLAAVVAQWPPSLF